MTARTKLTVLDRLHTLVTIGLGVAAIFALGLNLPKPSGTLAESVWTAVALGAGFGAAYVADVSFAHLVRSRRKQLLDAVRKAHPEA
ncbi:hypothetical protein F3K34_44270 [Streptomyces sp. LBUM 1486]|uniref:hypothetical protein n=1 Tax=Streptomyces scabiei TaxID=1930 RepID=UPI001B32FCB1|nr:hypothetical protein [Streptomyces sp. LBUM 1486]MBP5918796.1 hypothetical protein [Streptomyces sp. LBUM 1486]